MGFYRVMGRGWGEIIGCALGIFMGDIYTSDGLAGVLTSVDLRNLLPGNNSRIEAEQREKESRRKTPSAKRYIVYPGTIQGDLNTVVRRKTRAGRFPNWEMALGCKSSLNSIFARARGGGWVGGFGNRI